MTGAQIIAVDRGLDRAWGPDSTIVIHTRGQFWAAENMFTCRTADLRAGFDDIEIDEIAWRDIIDRVPEGMAIGPELIVTTSYVRNTGGGVTVYAEDMIVCGIGASGRPRCTPRIPVSLTALSAFVISPTISRTGLLRFALRVTHDEGTIDDDYLSKLRRTYQLDFP
jgi:hypothetical protein